MFVFNYQYHFFMKILPKFKETIVIVMSVFSSIFVGAAGANNRTGQGYAVFGQR